MRATKVEMILEKYADDMPPILKELYDKYKPKQLHCEEVEYFER